jgi:sorting nexin-4
LKSRDQKQIELEDLNQYLKDAIEERDKIIRTGDPHAGKSNPITHFITQKMDEFKGVDPEKAKKERLSKLENRISELQKGVSSSRETAQQFNDRLLSEFEHMNTLKEQEMKIYIKRYSERQIEYHEKVKNGFPLFVKRLLYLRLDGPRMVFLVTSGMKKFPKLPLNTTTS